MGVAGGQVIKAIVITANMHHVECLMRRLWKWHLNVNTKQYPGLTALYIPSGGWKHFQERVCSFSKVDK